THYEHLAAYTLQHLDHDSSKHISRYHSPCPRLSAAFLPFFFPTPAPTEIYTLSLHDALPICRASRAWRRSAASFPGISTSSRPADRKSTRLNSSHQIISYAVFCLKKKSTHTGRCDILGLSCNDIDQVTGFASATACHTHMCEL